MISIRKELGNILDRDKENNNIVYRHYSNTKCSCTQQPPLIYDPVIKGNIANPNYRTIADPDCPNCEGAGWVFEEYLWRCIFFYPGFRFSHFEDVNFAITAENTLTVYMKAGPDWDKVKPNDVFFNIRADMDGNIKLPIEKYRKWLVIDAFDIRLDSNKVEFVKVFAKPSVI